MIAYGWLTRDQIGVAAKPPSLVCRWMLENSSKPLIFALPRGDLDQDSFPQRQARNRPVQLRSLVPVLGLRIKCFSDDAGNGVRRKRFLEKNGVDFARLGGFVVVSGIAGHLHNRDFRVGDFNPG